jgi:capsular exopolysaccharide synthesis family protein
LKEELNFKVVKQEINILEKIKETYLPYWHFFLIAFIFSIFISFIYLRYTPKSYEINSKILIKDDNSKSGVGASKILEALDVFAEKKVVENEVEVLQSWPLMEEVVKNLNLYATQQTDGRIVGSELYGIYAPLNIIALNPDSISVPEDYNKSGKLITIDYKNFQFEFENKKYRFGDSIEIAGNFFKINLNPKFNYKDQYSRIRIQLNEVHPLAISLVKNLTLDPTSKKSTVLKATFVTNVPEKGLDILNELFRIYKKEALEDKNLVSTQTITFLDARLRKVKNDLDSVEADIVTFKKKNNIVDIEKEGQVYLNAAKESDSKLTSVSLQLSILDEIEAYLNNKGLNPGTVPSLIGISDPILLQLLVKLNEAESNLTKISAITNKNNDQQKQIITEIKDIKRNIRENVKNIRANLNSTKQNLENDFAKNNEFLKNIPQKQRQLIEVSRDELIKNATYSFLLQKREETAMSYASAVADSKVIEAADLNKTSKKPNSKLIYVFGLMISTFICIGIITIKEDFNSKVIFRKDIESTTQVPIIAELMQSSDAKDIVIKDGGRSLLAEQFRFLRTNLSYFGINKNKKVILISSSISGEGKSFVSSNLAISLSLTGKSVVILELDLRKPKISKTFNLPRDNGISNYLIGQAVLDDIIQPILDTDNLFVIGSGPIPPNPTELISSDYFPELMSLLRERFDYIIMDTPPIGLVTDAQILANYTDMSIFVVRHDYTPKFYLDMLSKYFAQNQFKSPSIVFNGLKPRGIAYGKYGYSYGYGYGYGYGEYGTGGYFTKDASRKKLGFLSKIFRS